jgi:hypothetical protein
MGQLYKDALDEIKRNRQRRLDGKIIAIPFPFQKFSDYVPGIMKRRYIIITANSKVGKSKITDYAFTYAPVEFILDNPDCGADIEIDVFSLEMSKSTKMKQYISYKLYREHNLSLNEEEIDSIYERYSLSDDVLRKIEELEPQIELFEQKVTYIDNIKNPTGIYKHVRDKHEKRGHYVDINLKEIPMRDIKNSDPEIVKKANFAIYKYVPDNPDLFYQVQTDHYGLLKQEKQDRDIRDTIGNFSSNYCIKMRDRWDAIVVGVQQQAASQESLDHIKESYTKPTANGLGENKTTQRDCDTIYGLYAPVRYKIKQYEGYNIANPKLPTEPLLEFHREFFTIMNRRGQSSVSTQLFFHGAVNFFRELPDPTNFSQMNQVEELLKQLKKLNRNG